MKETLLLIAVGFVVVDVASGQQTTAETPIDLTELSRRGVAGTLGLELGTTAEIEAEVIAGSSLRSKEYLSDYLLKVTRVDGRKLDRPPVLRFSVPGFASVKLANHTFSLYKMKLGTEANSLNSEQIAELERGYVGRTVRLVVYEVGSFGGMPRKLLKGVRRWLDVAFNFSTSLIVLDECD